MGSSWAGPACPVQGYLIDPRAQRQVLFIGTSVGRTVTPPSKPRSASRGSRQGHYGLYRAPGLTAFNIMEASHRSETLGQLLGSDGRRDPIGGQLCSVHSVPRSRAGVHCPIVRCSTVCWHGPFGNVARRYVWKTLRRSADLTHSV